MKGHKRLDMDEKNKKFTVLALIVLIITQVIMGRIGIKNISIKILVTLLIIACSITIIGIYQNIKNGYNKFFNIIFAMLAIILGISGVISIMIEQYNPILSHKYNLLFLIILLIEFFSLIIFGVVYRIIEYIKRN